MALVSWAYDHAAVESVQYEGDEVEITLCGRPDVIERARASAADVEP